MPNERWSIVSVGGDNYADASAYGSFLRHLLFCHNSLGLSPVEAVAIDIQ